MVFPYRHAHEMTSLRNELESMKELLHTYEQSIERKDDVIGNLTKGMQKQKDKYDMLKTFCEWKIRHNDTRREVRYFLFKVLLYMCSTWCIRNLGHSHLICWYSAQSRAFF